MASSMGHFPDPLHLTVLLLQLLEGINNTQKMIHNNQHYISKCFSASYINLC
jgi:hypothetical protein